jgi:peroxiredoxin
MLPTLMTLAMVLALLGADTDALAPGTQLYYRGSVAQLLEDRTAGQPEKTFDLTLLVAGTDARRLLWTVEERGRGSWPWIERFGALTVDEAWRPSGGQGPALLYEMGDLTSVINVVPPVLAGDRTLAAGASWQQGGLSFEVRKAAKLGERDVWQVEVSNNYGPQRTVWVDQQSPIAVGIDQRVFMGMGQEFELQLRLVGTGRLEAERLAAASEAFEALSALRGKLNRRERSSDPTLNPRQLGILAADLPPIEKLSAEPLEKIVRSARRDLESQEGRVDAVGKLAAEQIGQPAPQFSAEGLNREKLSQADLKGQVTVLHFWDYRDVPLKEPYGQVGYLDFLFQRRRAEGVKVYGVAVDGRLADEPDRSQATRGIRKLKAFMNLSYPILLDRGELIKKFGDPRLVGAELPLFVVIAPDGTIAHYHVGHYEVDRNEGLKPLNEAVSRLPKP